jgi:hypothetical protein
MEAEETDVGCNMQAHVTKTQPHCTKDLSAVQVRGIARQAAVEQSAEPALQCNESLTRQFAEIQRKLHVEFTPENPYFDLTSGTGTRAL